MTAAVVPFLRWAGSKRKLLPKLTAFWKQHHRRYVEPFAGSSALFFSLKPAQAVLGDLNQELIDTLTAVRDEPWLVYHHLVSLPTGREHFYDIRRIDPSELPLPRRAARFIYLNRFCFNGLYRTNTAGRFNVPYAPTGTGEIPTWLSFSSAAILLRRAELKSGDFEETITSTVKAGDLVYLDPPYAVGNRRVFKQYGPHVFGIQDLERLKNTLELINDRKATFVLSYAYCSEALNMFSNWTCRRVYTQRNISGFVRTRRRAAELIVTNASK